MTLMSKGQPCPNSCHTLVMGMSMKRGGGIIMVLYSTVYCVSFRSINYSNVNDLHYVGIDLSSISA